MDKDLISIIVTCYNREDYIQDCLTSILNQTYTNFECIIVDDGSTDNSLSIINKLVGADKRFKIIAHEHVGFPEAKNIGLANRSPDSKYTIFLDSDDMAHPEWLNLLHYVCITTGASIAICDYDVFEKAKQIKNFIFNSHVDLRMTEYSFLRMLFLYNQRCMHFMWNKLVRSDLYDDIHFVDQIALSDVAVMSDVFMKAKYVVHLRLPLIHYRQHPNSMCRTTMSKGAEYWIWRLNFQKEKLRKDYDRCPQARRVIQIVLQQEIKSAKEVLQDDFDKYCTLDDVKYILENPCVHFIEQ